MYVDFRKGARFRALKVADYSDMGRVGLDETSSKKGYNYVTIFVDMDD